MKKLLAFAMLAACLTMFAGNVWAQGSPNDTPEQKLHRASPPATASVTTNSGVAIKIDYTQPALKGRTMGKDIDPYVGKVWRTGANESTVFAIDKDVTVEGKKLSAGKYGLFTLVNNDG